MIKNRTKFKDLGADFFQNRNKDFLVRQNVKRLESLGFNVTLDVTI